MSEKKQVTKNIVLNIVSFSFRMCIGIWLIPYLIFHIGFTAYGFVPIAAILTEYISIITSAFNGAISRHLVLDLQREDWGKALQTFNSSFFCIMALAIIQIPAALLVMGNFNRFLTVPAFLYDDVLKLFVLSFLSFLITVMSSVFSASLYAKNRLDIMRVFDIAHIAIRVGTVVLFFTFDTPKLYYVGLGELLASLTVLVLSVLFWKKLTPKLHIAPSAVRKRYLGKIASMSGWLVINQLGYLLFLKIDLLVINKYIGTTEGGQYAAIMLWSNLIRTVVGVFSGIAGPLIFAAYAKNDYVKMLQVLQTTMKSIGIVVALFAGILMTLSVPLLTIWIGEEVALYAPLLVISLVHLPVNLSVIPLFSLNAATNRVRVPGIITLVSGVINFFLAIFFVTETGLGFYGVAIAGLIVLTIKNTVFSPLYAAKSIGVKWTTFFGPIKISIMMTFLVGLVGIGVSSLITLNSYFDLMATGGGIAVLSAPLLFFAGFRRSEQKKFIDTIHHKINAFRVLDKT